MRIADLRRTAPLLPRVETPRSRASLATRGQAPVHALRTPRGLSTRSAPVASFSEPEGALPTSANMRRTGTRLRDVAPRMRQEEVTPSPRLRLRTPPRGGDTGERAARGVLPKELHRATDPTRAKVRAAFRRPNPLLEPNRAPRCRACACYEGRTPSR